MNAPFQRALILHQQGRHADAERELRQALGVDPHDPFAHALLALCLVEQKQFDPASYEADAAVGLAPDLPFAHYARAQVLYGRNRHAEAADAVHEAIRLDARDPGFWALLAAVRFEQQRWADALQAAEEGLKVDPEHAGCTNLRAMALVKLGRRAEAGAAIGAALARDPQNAVTHANQGWAMLHRGDAKHALEHFREALRIDPELEWARAGMVEALKARHVVYRWMLMWFLWMARLGAGAQWAIILGGYVGYQVLGKLARSNPDLRPWVLPLMIAYVVFAVMTWLAVPLFDLLLRLNRFGRLLLTRRQTIASNTVGLLLLATVAALATGLARGEERWLLLAIATGLLMLPVSGAFRLPDGWPTVVMAVACGVLALLGLGGVALIFAAPDPGAATAATAASRPHPLDALGGGLFRLFTYGILISQIGYNYLRSVQVQR